MRCWSRWIPLLVVVAASPAQEIFVDAARGNDANPGTAARPVRSIGKGVSLAGNGGKVTILPGVYSAARTGERFPIRVGASVQQNGVWVRGAGSSGAVVVDLGGSTSAAFFVGSLAAGGRITNLTFRNSDRKGWWTRVVQGGTFAGPPTADHFEIDRCVFDSVNRGIVIWGRSKGWRVHHNLFVRLANDAIDEFDTQGAHAIHHNTIYAAPGGPAFVGILVESPNARVTSNLIVGMRDAFATGRATLPSSFVANDTWKNRNAFTGKITKPPPGNYAVDPRFRNAAAGDLRLLPGSPLLDAGWPGSGPAADLDDGPGAVDGNGDGRVVPDVGAYEIQPVRTTIAFQRASGALKVDLAGSPGQIGLVLLGLREGAMDLPGIGTLLLDPRGILPVVVVAGALPATWRATAPAQPPGVQLVLQGAAYAPARPAVTPSARGVLRW